MAPDASAQSPGQGVAEEFDRLHFRSIGPATMSGRIADVAVYEANPALYYVGTAHGGVWKTTNAGITFTPVFQNEASYSVGAVVIDAAQPNTIWVGSGEANNQRSSYWGNGVYKSTDGGKTWKFTLKDGIKWEDGKTVTCEDFAYGVSRTFAVDVITGGPNYAIAFLDIPKNSDGSSKFAGPYKKTGQDLFDKAVTCSGSELTFKLSQPVNDFNMAVTMTAFAAFRKDKDQGDKSNFAIFSNGPYKIDGNWTTNKGGTFVRNDQWDPATDTIRKAYPDKITWDESLTQETLYERLIANQGADQNAITLSLIHI